MPLEYHHEYQNVGWYSPGEARRLLAALEKAGIRFEIETSVASIQSQSAIQARYGGTFGSGSQVLIAVWSEDREAFNRIHREIFSV
jgi:hypothetical protein